jgi:hypothetical protein
MCQPPVKRLPAIAIWHGSGGAPDRYCLRFDVPPDSAISPTTPTAIWAIRDFKYTTSSTLITKELHQTSIHWLQDLLSIQSHTSATFDQFELKRLSALCSWVVASSCALVLGFILSLSRPHSQICKSSKRHISVWWFLWGLSVLQDSEEHSTGLSDLLREWKGWKRLILSWLLSGD